MIASLNGKSLGGGIDYSKHIEQAGADALELNIYFMATDLDQKSEDLRKEICSYR
ncbi:MAG: hypothetical protein U5J96_18655 [Ignavibacteriaceae bacterium]|nr:hypothetical protein [Ignavibacteriaceae bacterium]